MQLVEQVSKVREIIMHAKFIIGKKQNIYRHREFCYVDIKYCTTAMERET